MLILGILRLRIAPISKNYTFYVAQAMIAVPCKTALGNRFVLGRPGGLHGFLTQILVSRRPFALNQISNRKSGLFLWLLLGFRLGLGFRLSVLDIHFVRVRSSPEGRRLAITSFTTHDDLIMLSLGR